MALRDIVIIISQSLNIVEAPMKPVARLHLIKQREYEKRCPLGQGRGGIGALGNPSIGMYGAGK